MLGLWRWTGYVQWYILWSALIFWHEAFGLDAVGDKKLFVAIEQERHVGEARL